MRLGDDVLLQDDVLHLVLCIRLQGNEFEAQHETFLLDEYLFVDGIEVLQHERTILIGRGGDVLVR